MALRPFSTLKQLLRFNDRWWHFYEVREGRIRTAIVENVIRMLSCGLTIRGYAHFDCSNPNCSHEKKVPFSCNSRFCSTCGTKATEQWIATQQAVLPETPWQHITFTMPDCLWQLYQYNRHLLTKVSPLAAETLQKLSKKKGLLVGIFAALHTFGRPLNWNVHTHVSVTRGGLTEDYSEWKAMYFSKKPIMRMWRYSIVTLIRKAYLRGELILPPYLKLQCPTDRNVHLWLDKQYKKKWIVHFARPSKDSWNSISYLGRYIKRPPLSQSRLRDYDGHQVIFEYLNHSTKKYQTLSLDEDAFIQRFVQHIPDKGFRMIRYYGFLANRVRSKLLPIVYALTGKPQRETCTIRWPKMVQKSPLNMNPLECILCGSVMLLRQIVPGLSDAQLHEHHEALARMKKFLPQI